jgi:hypothetical protein
MTLLEITDLEGGGYIMTEQTTLFTDEGWNEFQKYLDFLPEEERADFMEEFVKLICCGYLM